MKTIAIALFALFATQLVYAADVDCAAKAAEKKLAGAAKSSFMKKCEKDAKAASPAAAAATPAAASAAGASDCAAKAVSKKNGKPLKGAAKSAFMKKCEKDAKAAPAGK